MQGPPEAGGTTAKSLLLRFLGQKGRGRGTLPGDPLRYFAAELTSEQCPAALPHRHLLSAAAVGERSA